MLTIGSLSILNPYIQAPLAGYSNRAYRHLVIEHSCFLTTSEMISVEGLWRKSKNTLKMISLSENEKHFCIQLFGKNPESYKKAVDVLLNNLTPSVVDINAGCPVKKVMKTGAGASMMADLDNTREVIKVLKNALGNIPLTIKFRLGINRGNPCFIEFADNALSAGADAISLHTRFASDLYSGSADFESIRVLREKFPSSTILASGDVFSYEIADRYMNDYGINGVLIARGAIGNPFIFEKINPDTRMRKAAFDRHFELLCYYEGKERAELEIRKFKSRYKID